MTSTYFSTNRYSKSKLERSVPLYLFFQSLDDILYEVYKKRLVFDKVFEVQITYTLDATFEVKAKNEEEAREIADEIGICTDPVFDYEDDPTECAINESRVGYLQRKVD